MARRMKWAEKEGSAFWGRFIEAAARITGDWNTIYIHPASSLFSKPSHRFTAGYRFAEENFRKLREHFILNGNICNMVAYGHGVAFAEGVAAFLYEEKGIKTETAIFIQGSGMNHIPQTRSAIECRMVFQSSGPKGFGKRSRNRLKVSDIVIQESELKGGFCKYSINLDSQMGDMIHDHLYLRANLSFIGYRKPQLYRQFQLATVLRHALNLFNETRAEAVTSGDGGELQNNSLRQYLLNHN